MTSYCKYPLNITFQGQQKDEAVLLFLRADVITNVPWIISVIFLFCIPLVLRFILNSLNIAVPPFPFNTFFILLFFYYLIVFGFILVNLLIWFNTIYLVTDKRILSVGLSNIARIDQNQIFLIDIIDFSSKKNPFLNFGEVTLRSDTMNITIHNIPNPTDATQFIQNTIKGNTYA